MRPISVRNRRRLPQRVMAALSAAATATAFGVVLGANTPPAPASPAASGPDPSDIGTETFTPSWPRPIAVPPNIGTETFTSTPTPTPYPGG